MIDTIKLTLSKGMFLILDKNVFEKGKTNAGRGYATLVQNPTPSELKRGIYKPRLTLTNRFNTTGRCEETLSVELSLPKLLYGNNFDELTEGDFNTVVEKLGQTLKRMGVLVFADILAKAPVSAAHFSKNIPLTDGSTPHYLIGKLKEANISLALDTSESVYRNDGSSYKWHANSYEVAFYDKLKDLENARKRGNKRAIEPSNQIQLGLFDTLREADRFEVLRMEVRLNTRQKIRALFRKLGIAGELTFENLFNSTTSQKILNYYLSEIDAKRPKITAYGPTSIKGLIASITTENPKIKPSKVLQLVGLRTALKEIPTRELRTMFNRYKDWSWYRLMAEAQNVNIPRGHDPLQVVRDCLESFEPLKLVDFQAKMLNNDKDTYYGKRTVLFN
jgi:hypothetical protein